MTASHPRLIWLIPTTEPAFHDVTHQPPRAEAQLGVLLHTAMGVQRRLSSPVLSDAIKPGSLQAITYCLSSNDA
ncbi:hypothetical protein LMH87_002549 [Akanthomyces muscarius]|uniref:Uncharacterized protein n=1 Tax=Akanthomyces muscarius TaxID=2231603 RepID=A0A9W8Q919_AKAMU|nr:hypothetical protein LMH87_002549 [Akanthomyces muscarius]KAJ4148061.1 hypothetical protein LMH87_002549 [Akanthomyces muscarius]